MWALFRAKEGDDQRIWLFTCDDDPNADDPVARSQSIQKAKESEEQLKRLEILQQREQKLNVETPIQMAELQRLSSNRDFIARNGLVTVTSSGWQQGVVHDVLSERPKYSWSKYHWDAGSSPSHPEGKAAGAWFQPPVHRRIHCYMHSCWRSHLTEACRCHAAVVSLGSGRLHEQMANTLPLATMTHAV